MGGDEVSKHLQIGGEGFYPRHPYGWRPRNVPKTDGRIRVSIHATRMGGDFKAATPVLPLPAFLSTPPVWVATPARRLATRSRQSFYPRHPYGWRQQKRTKKIIHFCAIRTISSFLFIKMQHTAKRKAANQTLKILLFNDFSAKPTVKSWYLPVRTYIISTSSCANSG